MAITSIAAAIYTTSMAANLKAASARPFCPICADDLQWSAPVKEPDKAELAGAGQTSAGVGQAS